MTINSTRVVRNKIEPKASYGTMSQTSNEQSQFMTLTITTTQSSINSDSRCRIARKKGLASPYLTGDKVKLSRVTEKKVVHKKPLGYDLSLPSATNIFKANSDEIRVSKRNNKKVKKSVLTLPNESNAEGIVCTVSDVNDFTEYNKDQRDRERKVKNRKRLPIQTRKSRIRDKDFEYYDRDARYCSQMNIDLDCSSTDMIKHFNGDGRSRRVSKKKAIAKVSETESKLDPHDVWAVLRNINQFQFTPSPPMSDYSIQSKKKKRTNKKRNSHKDARVIETCHTEEFAYISSFDVNRSHTSFSQASSIDRITVIDKQDEFSHFCQEFEKKFLSDSKNIKVQNKFKSGNQSVVNKRNNKSPKTNSKPKEKSNQLIPLIDKKAVSNKPNEDQLHKDEVESNINSHNIDTLCLEYKEDIQENNDLYNNTLCSVNSGSSKAGLNDFVNKTKTEGNKSLYSDESNPQMKGITKVVLSKAPDSVVSKRSNAPIRKPRLVTTMPSTAPPKLTQTEIKRRLANKKFPIVVLEKDELGCSSIEVPLFEPVQFHGLDQHIWPFMRDWFNNDSSSNLKNKSKNNNNTTSNTQHGKVKHTINNHNFPENKVISSKDRKFNMHNTKKTDPKRINAISDTKAIMQEQATKSKPMKQFKDKMLKLLYKKSTEDFTRNDNQTGGQGDMKNLKILQNPKIEKRVTKVDAATDTIKILNQQNAIQYNRRVIGSPQRESNHIPLPITRHPWAKGKWASDFIDSVIKKVKNGIYYSQDKKVLCKKCCKDSKEASIQTALTIKSDEELKAISRVEDIPVEASFNKTIPGFDEVLAPVEIKTLNMKQITVKHCLTNVLLQFDVSVPVEKKNISVESQKSLFTPLLLTDGHSKIIKCKTTILNAIMPAELCSIIPKMMRNITSNTNMQVAFHPILPKKSDIQLATITELSQQKSSDSIKCSITPFSFMSMKVRAFLAGNFPQSTFDNKQKRLPENKNKIRIVLNSNYRNIVTELLKEIEIVPLLCHHHIFYLETMGATVNKLCRKELPAADSSKCLALQPYVPPKPCVAPTFGIQNVIKLLQHMCYKNVVVNFDFPKYFPMSVGDIKVTVHLNKSTEIIDVQDVPSSSKNLQIDSLFNGYLKSGDCRSSTSQRRCFEDNNNCNELDKNTNRIQEKKQKYCQSLSHTKTKKKCFVRLYKKCKSTSNISAEKSTTAICKITNLDHFFQALGSGKLLSSVFDGYAEKKILSSIAEMKNWITDISQRQAMLVLLLTNKKDTQNLVRYRPVLLQGIAVNRITRASELDMEIEVIETENLNKRQYEGISYLSASERNNNLLEELYWIAKTTASDYQKPFDESSERLLKSLTEKRKKLNPSYLRVMARYVGLGLLKPPKK